MKGDFLKNAFDIRKHYRGVLKQQGRVLLDADFDEEAAILSYLAEHPNAQDTLEGIVHWWLLEQRQKAVVRRVMQSLEELVRLGLVVCLQSPDGRAHYRFNRQNASVAAKRLRVRRKTSGKKP